jgi:hypothetical protein
VLYSSSSKSEYGNGTNAAIKTLLIQNVLVLPFPVQLIYCIFIKIQTKGKTLWASFGDDIVGQEYTDRQFGLTPLDNNSPQKTMWRPVTTEKRGEIEKPYE